MATVTPSAALIPVTPVFSTAERLAVAGFLAGYSGLTREAYELDLRQYAAWCRAHGLALFAARRADTEGFARDLEARGRARATITRRLCTIAGLYRYAVEEELLDNSPAAHVRRPRLDYESRAVGLDRNEMGALLVAAGLGPPADHALISLLALNGLRVSEATGADIENLGIERGHRTLVITRKGGKVVTVPLAPRTARAIDRRAGRRGTAARRAGRRLARRPADHCALRPGPGIPGPPRHLHRRRLRRRGRPLNRAVRPADGSGRATGPSLTTDRDGLLCPRTAVLHVGPSVRHRLRSCADLDDRCGERALRGGSAKCGNLSPNSASCLPESAAEIP